MMGQSIKNNLQRVYAEIEAAKKQSDCPYRQISLIAVSKKQSVESILTAYNEGQTQFAENYLQEAILKIDNLKEKPIEWHFIGAIQTNKIKLITSYFSWVQSVCRLKEIKMLNECAGRKKINICLQINIDNDPKKAGVKTEAELKMLLSELQNCSNLIARGLMILPAKHDDYAKQYASFTRAFLLYKKMRDEGFKLDTLSMGMSADLSPAIAAGSNMVRIGTALFGER